MKLCVSVWCGTVEKRRREVLKKLTNLRRKERKALKVNQLNSDKCSGGEMKKISFLYSHDALHLSERKEEYELCFVIWKHLKGRKKTITLSFNFVLVYQKGWLKRMHTLWNIY